MSLNIFYLSPVGLFDEIKEWLLIFLLGLGVVLTGLIVFLLIKELLRGSYTRSEANEADFITIEHEPKKTQLEEPTTTIKESENSKKSEEEIVAAIMAAISAHTGKPLTAFRVIRFQERV